MTASRNVLFLQGMATQFFARLGLALSKRNHAVHRINFNGGDWLFWPLPGAVNYRGDIRSWPAYLERHLVKWAITDVVLFGDCRPLHREAIRVAMLRGIRVHVVDEGYIRPNWITFEQNGVNGNSSLPRDPDWFRTAARDVPEWDGGVPVHGSFRRRAIEDVLYNVTSFLLAWRYPRYRTHRPWHAFVEYGGWLRKFARKPFAKQRTRRAMADISARAEEFFFFPLQLDCDSQIRQHSHFGRIAPAIETVIASFADHAPSASFLVVKEHPLDNGLTDWRSMVQTVAAANGVAERVIYLEGGVLDWLLDRCRGVITVNSTVGFLGLAFGRPVASLGEAIYDMPGLTFQGGLDDFWRNGTCPDPATFDAFRRVAVGRTQINGGFFSLAGLDLAVGGAVARVEAALPDRRPAFAASLDPAIDPAEGKLAAASLAS